MSFIKQEFALDKFGLSNIEPERFYVPVWKRVSKEVRWVLQGVYALYTLVFMVISLTKNVEKHRNAKWFTFLTSWNYMMCTTFFITAFIVNIKNGKKHSKTDVRWKSNADSESPEVSVDYGSTTKFTIEANTNTDMKKKVLKREEKFYWLLFSIVWICCLMVVLIYWGFLYTPGQFDDDTTLEVYISIDRHGIVYFLLFLEYILADVPLQLLHFVYPVTFVSLYLIFNVIYWACTGKIIYSVINWGDNPTEAVGFIFGALIATTILTFVLFLVDTGKRKLSQQSCCCH